MQLYNHAGELEVSMPERLSSDDTKARLATQLSVEDSIWKTVCTSYLLTELLVLQKGKKLKYYHRHNIHFYDYSILFPTVFSKCENGNSKAVNIAMQNLTYHIEHFNKVWNW